MIAREVSIIATLAWRNVWKNRRRTVLTLLTIMVGCAMIILMNAFAKGGHDQMIEDAVKENNGHIQVHEKGFWENRGIDYAFSPKGDLLEGLKNVSEIEASARRIHAGGLLSYGSTTSGALIQGIEPSKEAEITTMKKSIVRGSYLDDGDTTQILVGETLAKNMGADLGSKIALISQGFDGSIAAEYLFVKGVFKSPNPEYDRALVLMTFTQARETFLMMDYINSIVIRLRATDQSMAVRDRVRAMPAAAGLEVMAWDELMPEMVQFIVMDDVSGYIFDFILFMVVAFGVLNTIQMSVFERTREFGVMLAIGTRPGQVVWMVMAESLVISLLGVLLGLALGALVSYYFNVNPIDYSAYAEEMSVWGMSTLIFPAVMTAANGAVTALVTLALSLLFSIAPARRASRLRPIEAIRQL
jgi:putative ABC transport system permease protein